MPIASIGSSANIIPPLEFPGRETRASERRETLVQVAVSLPGNGERSDSEEREPNRMAVDIASSGQALNRRLQFVVDHQSNEVLVKVIDSSTDEVVRVLPPEELQRLYRKQGTNGSLLNEQV